MIVWKLDEVLRLRGLKGRELARQLEIGENYLSRVRHEVPDRLSLSLLDGLCRELNCTIGDLLEFRPGEQLAQPAGSRQVALRGRRKAEATDDFTSIVAAALGEALELEPEEAQSPPPQRWSQAPVPEGHTPAPAAAEEASLPPQRWSQAPVPEGHMDAANQAKAPGSVEPTPSQAGSTVVKTRLLSAKLDRLKQRRL